MAMGRLLTTSKKVAVAVLTLGSLSIVTLAGLGAGTAAAEGLDVAPPATIDADGTHGDFGPAVDYRGLAIDGVMDEDGLQADDVRYSFKARP